MVEITALLGEAGWLERLARSLASDRAEADDAVQETWLAAMRSPPDPDRPVRPWLRRVLVNALRMRHRTRKRRETHEQETEPFIEQVRTPEQLLERALLERRLADLVLALEEPYRSTVLLRYRDGHSAETIALQQGVPAGTVRRRLKTALDRMRSELDGGARGRRHAVLAPLLGVKGVMGQAASKGGLALVIALVALLGGIASVVGWRVRSASRDEIATSSSPRSASVEHAPPQRAAIAELAQAGVADRELAGRVTEGGRPFAGATVRLAHAETQTVVGETTSDARGHFTFGALAATAYVVVASAPNRAPGIERVDLRAPPRDVVLELSPCSRLVGKVIEGSGAPIAGARVSNADAPWPFTEAKTDGSYELCVPFGRARVLFSASGYGGVLAILTRGSRSIRSTRDKCEKHR
jgi:RNA polymerase sigma factor (sigma-70 family)